MSHRNLTLSVDRARAIVSGQPAIPYQPQFTGSLFKSVTAHEDQEQTYRNLREQLDDSYVKGFSNNQDSSFTELLISRTNPEG